MKRIRYCSKCPGKPYIIEEYGKKAIYQCPCCGSYLNQATEDETVLETDYIPMAEFQSRGEVYIKEKKEKGDLLQSVLHEKAECIESISSKIENEDKGIRISVGTELQESCAGSVNVITDNVSEKCMNHSIQNSVVDEEKYFAKKKKHNRVDAGKEEKTEDVLHKDYSENDKTVLLTNNVSNFGNSDRRIQGVIERSANDANHKRPLYQKLTDKVLYRQRVSDVYNYIDISLIDDRGIELDEGKVRLVFHGNAEGGIESFSSGKKITARGRYKGKNEFFASSILLDESVKSIQVENGDVWMILTPILVLALIFILFASIPEGMTVVEAITYAGTKIKNFFICDVILTAVITSVAYFSTRRGIRGVLRGFRRISFRACLLLGFIISTLITFLFIPFI